MEEDDEDELGTRWLEGVTSPLLDGLCFDLVVGVLVLAYSADATDAGDRVVMMTTSFLSAKSCSVLSSESESSYLTW